jgi:hypothetical protein
MTWVDAVRTEGASLELRPGASATELNALERRVGPIPHDLRALLQESDGIYDRDGQWEVAWSCDRMAAETERLRAEGLVADDEVAFGDNGAGDPFVMPVHGDGQVMSRSMVTGESSVLASSLPVFWTRWLRGEIST